MNTRRLRVAPGLSTSAAESIRPKMQAVYLSHLEKFQAWLRLAAVPRWELEMIDETLEECLCEPY